MGNFLNSQIKYIQEMVHKRTFHETYNCCHYGHKTENQIKGRKVTLKCSYKRGGSVSEYCKISFDLAVGSIEWEAMAFLHQMNRRSSSSSSSSSSVDPLPIILVFLIVIFLEKSVSVVSDLEYSKNNQASNSTLESIYKYLRKINKPAVKTFEVLCNILNEMNICIYEGDDIFLLFFIFIDLLGFRWSYHRLCW